RENICRRYSRSQFERVACSPTGRHGGDRRRARAYHRAAAVTSAPPADQAWDFLGWQLPVAPDVPPHAVLHPATCRRYHEPRGGERTGGPPIGRGTCHQCAQSCFACFLCSRDDGLRLYTCVDLYRNGAVECARVEID